MTMPFVISERARIRLRRDSAENWELFNPILHDGEPGFDQTTNMLKIGDGVTPWRDLDYLTPPDMPPIVVTGDMVIDAVMSSHINDATPHPVYDDGPNLFLLYENAKV